MPAAMTWLNRYEERSLGLANYFQNLMASHQQRRDPILGQGDMGIIEHEDLALAVDYRLAFNRNPFDAFVSREDDEILRSAFSDDLSIRFVTRPSEFSVRKYL